MYNNKYLYDVYNAPVKIYNLNESEIEEKFKDIKPINKIEYKNKTRMFINHYFDNRKGGKTWIVK